MAEQFDVVEDQRDVMPDNHPDGADSDVVEVDDTPDAPVEVDPELGEDPLPDDALADVDPDEAA